MADKSFLGNAYGLTSGDATRKHYDDWADS